MEDPEEQVNQCSHWVFQGEAGAAAEGHMMILTTRTPS